MAPARAGKGAAARRASVEASSDGTPQSTRATRATRASRANAASGATSTSTEPSEAPSVSSTTSPASEVVKAERVPVKTENGQEQADDPSEEPAEAKETKQDEMNGTVSPVSEYQGAASSDAVPETSNSPHNNDTPGADVSDNADPNPGPTSDTSAAAPIITEDSAPEPTDLSSGNMEKPVETNEGDEKEQPECKDPKNAGSERDQAKGDPSTDMVVDDTEQTSTELPADKAVTEVESAKSQSQPTPMDTSEPGAEAADAAGKQESKTATGSAPADSADDKNADGANAADVKVSDGADASSATAPSSTTKSSGTAAAADSNTKKGARWSPEVKVKGTPGAPADPAASAAAAAAVAAANSMVLMGANLDVKVRAQIYAVVMGSICYS